MPRPKTGGIGDTLAGRSCGQQREGRSPVRRASINKEEIELYLMQCDSSMNQVKDLHVMVQSRFTGVRSRSFAVLWDLDGVLVDTRDWHFASWKDALARYGKQLSEEEFRASFGQRNPETIPQWLPGASAQTVSAVSDLKEKAFRDDLPELIPLLPGVEALVKDLSSAGSPQAIASSAPRANLEAMLPRMGIPIDVVVSGEDVREGKPDPEVFLTAADRLGMPAERCIVVEDAVAGVEAARRAGMKCLAVANTWPSKQLMAADLVVDGLEEVSVQDIASLTS